MCLLHNLTGNLIWLSSSLRALRTFPDSAMCGPGRSVPCLRTSRPSCTLILIGTLHQKQHWISSKLIPVGHTAVRFCSQVPCSFPSIYRGRRKIHVAKESQTAIAPTTASLKSLQDCQNNPLRQMAWALWTSGCHVPVGMSTATEHDCGTRSVTCTAICCLL